MPKITLIGAGSVVFTRNLCSDILLTPALQNATITLDGYRRRPAGAGARSRPGADRWAQARRAGRGHHRPARGAARGRLCRHNLSAGRPGGLQARHRDPAKLWRRAVRRRYARPWRCVPRAAHHPGADRRWAARWTSWRRMRCCSITSTRWPRTAGRSTKPPAGRTLGCATACRAPARCWRAGSMCPTRRWSSSAPASTTRRSS